MSLKIITGLRNDFNYKHTQFIEARARYTEIVEFAPRDKDNGELKLSQAEEKDADYQQDMMADGKEECKAIYDQVEQYALEIDSAINDATSEGDAKVCKWLSALADIISDINAEMEAKSADFL